MIYKNQPYLILDKETLKEVGSVTLGELIEEFQFTTKIQLDAYLVKHNIYHDQYILIENDLDINYLPDEDGLTDKMFYDGTKYQYYVNSKGEAYRINKQTLKQEKIKVHYKGKLKSPYIYCKGLSNSGISLRYIMALSYFRNYRKVKNKSMYIVEALDGMSEKKTLKEKEQYCIRYVYNEVTEERSHKERYSDASGLYKKPVDKKQLKLFADYVLYHWRNNEEMCFRQIIDKNGYVKIYDLNGNNVTFCKNHNIELYQKYINSIASIKYPYDKYPQMYLAYEKGGIKHIDFLTYKLKDTNKDDYAIFDKKAWTLAKADKEYVELKPFDIESFLNEEFELMPNYKGKEEIVNQHKVINTAPLNKISFEDVDLKYLKNNKDKNDKAQQNLKSKNTHSEYE